MLFKGDLVVLAHRYDNLVRLLETLREEFSALVGMSSNVEMN